MAPKLRSRLEMAANIATILAVLLIGFVVVRYYVGVNPMDVRQESFRLVGISGTPVVFYVGRNGQVAKHWVGKLPPSQEYEVLSFLKGDQL